VSLPGLGSFIIEDRPSKLMDDGRLITAPTRTVQFSVKETWNDEVLERAYAAELEGAMLVLDDDEFLGNQQAGGEHGASKLFLEQAKREVAQFVASIENQLQSNGIFQLPGLGMMKMEGKRKGITFLKSKECDLAPQEFGLSPISVKPLSSPSRLVDPPIVKHKEIETKEIEVVQTETKEIETIERKPKEEKIKIRKPKKRVPKWRYVLLGTLLVIILTVLLAYIFRKELEPLWWKLLYTEEQRKELQVQRML